MKEYYKRITSCQVCKEQYGSDTKKDNRICWKCKYKMVYPIKSRRKYA
jgi:hypothetical protein